MARTSKKSKFSSKKYQVGALAVVAVIIAGGLWYHGHNNKSPAALSNPASRNTSSSKINYSAAPAADNNANNDRKGASPTNTNQTLDQNTSIDFSVVVTRANSDGQNVEVASLVNGVTSGDCTLSLSQSGQSTITRTNNVQQQNDSYVCPVFSIPISDFPSTGSWMASMSVTSNGKTATSNSESFNL